MHNQKLNLKAEILKAKWFVSKSIRWMPRHFALGWRIPLALWWPMSPTSPAARWGQSDSFNWPCVFLMFFPLFLFICLYGSDTNSCGLVVRCWWRISCVQAPCQRCNWRNMEWYMNNIWISWNVYLTRSFGWKFEGAKVAKTCSAGGSDADGWPPVRQMLAWVLWCGAGWISAAERIANVWA